jgi:hypothetical protein
MKKAIITFRKARAVVKTSTVTTEVLSRIFVDVWPYDVAKAMRSMDSLRQGNTVKFKYRGLTGTVKPIYDREAV